MRLKRALVLLSVLLVAADAGKSAKVDAELKRFQGRWTMVSYEDNGKPDALFANATQVFEGDRYTVTSGEKLIRKGKFEIDPTTTPPSIDLLPDIGPYKGKRLSGIYELQDDRLKTCFPDPGAERPKKFDSSAGSNLSQVNYKRAKQGL